ncbi:hypothetical protein ALC60_00940 [Trachymyrmex zeteki]|uniref:CCHC-type domain-containing protein n=1 Tax=Mycetomoellerius zeteki TaxID=64791 RepID=A0A151XIB4_9HYME|nr:hypothetical protein ALC60_00940 [Trachymyrmex zeteki]
MLAPPAHDPKAFNPTRPTYKYSNNDISSYVVYVYSDKPSTMHFSVLSRIISDSIKNDILLIKRLGAGKAIIEAKSADAANRLLSNPVFEKNNLRAFIPSFKVLRSGIIRGVLSVQIKFAGQILPSEIVLFNALYKVYAFVPKAKICYTCYRVGHIERDCKSSRPRCLFCGSSCEEDHSCPANKSQATCINCGRASSNLTHLPPHH